MLNALLYLSAVSSTTVCDPGKYGIYCNETCNCNCSNNITCNSMTGECPSECLQAGRKRSFILIVIFAPLGVVFITILIMFVCSLVVKGMKKRKTSDTQVMLDNGNQRQGSKQSYSNSVINEITEEPKETNYRIHVSDLERYVVQGRKNGTLEKEFEFILESSVSSHLCTVGSAKENERKNRYNTILPYDYTRVILEKLPNDPHSDYINASYINGYKSSKKYIAAQGPKPLRMADFWRMIWQEESCKIVMVTNLIESGETKCKKYWPKKTDHYGSLKIQLVDSDVSVDFTIRTFILSENGKTREVKQFHFTSWPEMKTPFYTQSLLTFIGNVRDYQPLHQCPIVVHSSAGTGRTGAFILLDYMLDMIQWEKHVDFVKCVCDMREQRMDMVETAEQYVFIYEALLDSLRPFETSIQCCRFNTHLKEIKCIDPETGQTRIKEEFMHINRLYHSNQNYNNQTESLCWMNNAKSNQAKIPLPPRDELSCQHHSLNFVDVDGYRKRKAFLLTAVPNESQLKNFWNTVYITNSLTIVLLNNIESFAEKDVPRYWPREGHVVNFGEFSIEYVNKECEEDGIVIRNFKLINNNENKSPKETLNTKKLKHFQLSTWGCNEKVPSSPMLLINLIAKVEKWRQETPKHSVIIQCMDGIRASGLFCTCYFVCNKIKLEKEVDVYLAVRTIRESCPNAIDDLEQYTFNYMVAASFLKKFHDYANFS